MQFEHGNLYKTVIHPVRTQFEYKFLTSYVVEWMQETLRKNLSEYCHELYHEPYYNKMIRLGVNTSYRRYVTIDRRFPMEDMSAILSILPLIEDVSYATKYELWYGESYRGTLEFQIHTNVDGLPIEYITQLDPNPDPLVHRDLKIDPTGIVVTYRFSFDNTAKRETERVAELIL